MTAGDIADKLTAQVGEEVDRRKIVLTDAIRTSGEHTVTVHVIGKLRPTVKVIVNGIVDEEAEDTEGADASE